MDHLSDIARKNLSCLQDLNPTSITFVDDDDEHFADMRWKGKLSVLVYDDGSLQLVDLATVDPKVNRPTVVYNSFDKAVKYIKGEIDL